MQTKKGWLGLAGGEWQESGTNGSEVFKKKHRKKMEKTAKSAQEITQKDFRTGSTEQDGIIWHYLE